MQGLRVLYQHSARTAEWSRLVEEIIPEFVDPKTERPLPGKEDDWSLVAGYRVGLAMWARQWEAAERLQTADVDWNRRLAEPILAKPPDMWSAEDKATLRTVAVSLQDLSDIQRERGLATCVDGNQEALSLAERIQDAQLAAICAFNLGTPTSVWTASAILPLPSSGIGGAWMLALRRTGWARPDAGPSWDQWLESVF